MQDKTIGVSLVAAARPGVDLEAALRAMEAALSGAEGGWEVVVADAARGGEGWDKLREAAAARPWLRGVRLAHPVAGWLTGRASAEQAALLAGAQSARGDVVIIMDIGRGITAGEIAALRARVEGGADVAYLPRDFTRWGRLGRKVVRPIVAFVARHAYLSPGEPVSDLVAARRAVWQKAASTNAVRPVARYHVMPAGFPSVASAAVASAATGGIEKMTRPSASTGAGLKPAPTSRHTDDVATGAAGATGADEGALAAMGLSVDVFFGYTALARPLLVFTALCLPAAVLGLWFLAVLLAVVGLEAASALAVTLGIMLAVAAVMASLYVIGELAIRASGRGAAMYVVRESF